MSLMANYNRREYLKAIHFSKKSLTYQKIDVAIKRSLIRYELESINFNRVANESQKQYNQTKGFFRMDRAFFFYFSISPFVLQILRVPLYLVFYLSL